MLNLFVLTGGPGSGKSTLISALREQGIRTVEESGRAVIRDEIAVGGDALPWGDRARFAQLMLDRDIESYERMRAAEAAVIFDRGIPDIVGYLRLCDLPVPDAADQAASKRRYNRWAFLAPHWPEIYVHDVERKQAPEEAARTFRVMQSVYREYGYEPVELPRASVEERVAFVLEKMRT